jgi:hypothetical protein
MNKDQLASLVQINYIESFYRDDRKKPKQPKGTTKHKLFWKGVDHYIPHRQYKPKKAR